jgi:NAD(P)-dependent dehydrogenase (short-subunit alcohol dehydrogenase family)
MIKKNLFDLRGQKILLTGATGYLGLEMTHALLSHGAHVFINGRNEDKVNRLFNKLKNKNVTNATFDINDYKKVKNFFLKNKKFHSIINNGFSGHKGDFYTFDEVAYNESFKTGITSVAHLINCATKSLKNGAKEIGTSSIINISSMYGMVSPNSKNYKFTPFNNPPYYGASKAGLIQYTKYAATYLAKDNIRVNSISPGPFPNKITQRNKLFIKNLKQNVPLDRIGKPKDLRTSIIFLCSSNSSYITGANIPVDGGWTAW